jgi:hypothetical protein
MSLPQAVAQTESGAIFFGLLLPPHTGITLGGFIPEPDISHRAGLDFFLVQGKRFMGFFRAHSYSLKHRMSLSSVTYVFLRVMPPVFG